jgi:hypothetical protein
MPMRVRDTCPLLAETVELVGEAIEANPRGERQILLDALSRPRCTW